MTVIDEIAPDLFRLSIYVPAFDMQFNHFLVRDEEPSYSGQGDRLLVDLAGIIKENFDQTR